MALYDLVNIDSGNGLAPIWRQAFTWTNVDLLTIVPIQTNVNKILIEREKNSFEENSVENVVCKMSAILSRPQHINMLHHALYYWTVVKSHTSMKHMMERDSCQEKVGQSST